jgi:hypothetical protein
MTKAGEAWSLLFDEYGIEEEVLANGYFDIESKHFKQFHLEPRLLTKIDHSHQLPPVMKKLGLSLLTLSSSSWRIGPFNIFASLPEWQTPDHTVVHKSLPDWLESLKANGITGEGALINAADASGIFADFFGEEPIATISGKARSGSFDFSINNYQTGITNVQVRSAQIEIDAGFEGQQALYLVEAKKHLSLDFNVRQLYYPFKTWRSRVAKPVKPVFITLANDVFDITEFAFTSESDFSSIKMMRTQRYMLTSDEISTSEIFKFAKSIELLNLPSAKDKIPFPQADDFERVIDMLEFVATEPRTSESIAENYEFHPRQADYYFSAVRYLGLGELVKHEDGKNYRQLNEEGQQIANLPFAAKRMEIAKRLLQIPALRQIYISSIQSGHEYSIRDAEQVVAQTSSEDGISGKTIKRRAQTILSWAKWLLALGA